jgi:hypothetical protein
MIQAKILLRQRRYRRSFAEIHRTNRILKHLRHGPQTELQ